MKYSVVFCYRDRAAHLALNIPQVRAALESQGKEVEIIVVEQDDNLPFRRGNLLNEGAKLATGDIVVLHDVDYWPTENTTYHDEVSDVFLPVKKVEFVRNDLSVKALEEIPLGYRHFKDSVDDNFYGGVISFKLHSFFKCNGYCPLYKGWGLEDADLRERVIYHSLTVMRGDGIFKALDHPDSAPPKSDINFQNNIHIFSLWRNYILYGARSQLCAKEFVSSIAGVDVHVKVKDFDIITKLDKQ